MFSYDQIIKSIRNHKTCLKPSTVCDGVGIFAFRDIQKDELIYEYLTEDDEIYLKDLNDVNSKTIDYLKSMCYYNNDEQSFTMDVPLFMFYNAYYINHSDNPNVFWDRYDHFQYAIRDIKEGEELTTYYRPNERDWL